jgi:hypothetical protein
MKKILFLLLGMQLNHIAMEPAEAPKDGKQKRPIELIERNALSSGSVAPSSVTKVTSTSTVASGRTATPDSSSLDSDMAQIDLDKDGHAMTRAQKRRSLVPVDANNLLDDVAIAETVLQVLQAREKQKKQQQEVAMNRLQTNDKQEKRKSVNLWLRRTKSAVPQLNLGDIEQGIRDSSLSDEELERIINFIVQATGNDVIDIKDRLKATLRELHNTPPASPLFSEKASAIDALNTVRKLTNDHVSTTRVVTSLRKKEQPVHALQPADVITHEGFEAGLSELLKLVNTEFATKLTQTSKARNIYKGLTILAGAATAGFTVYEAYNKATGGDSTATTPTCPPSTTFPM